MIGLRELFCYIIRLIIIDIISETINNPKPYFVLLDLDGNTLWGPSQPISHSQLSEIIAAPVVEPRKVDEDSLKNVLLGYIKKVAHVWRWPYVGAQDAVRQLRDEIGPDRLGVLTGRHKSNLARITYGQLSRIFDFEPEDKDNIFLRPAGYKGSSDWKLAKLLEMDEHRVDKSTPIILIDNEVALAARIASVAQLQGRRIYVILKKSYATQGKEELLAQLTNLRMYSEFTQWPDIINDIIQDSQKH